MPGWVPRQGRAQSRRVRTVSDVGPAPDVRLEEVIWRVDSKPFERDGSHVARYVPYLNAATVARLLDEWVGPDGWSDEYETGTLNGREVLWCHLTVRGTTKSDVGVSPGGASELADKGLVSDAFKRAGSLKWGAGRNVYTLPTLWAPCRVTRDGKARPAPDVETELVAQLRSRGYDVNRADAEHEPETRTEPDGGGTGSVEAPTGSAFPCPLCGAGTYDNRADNDDREARGLKRRPDFKCTRPDECGWFHWDGHPG